MKKFVPLFTVALALFSPSAWSQVSVTATGAGPLTFDTAPATTDFATAVLIGDGNTFNNTGQIDTAVAGLDQSAVMNVMATSATQPPSTSSTGFRYNTAGLFIQSRPTTSRTNAANMLMGRFRNYTGSPMAGCDIAYDMAVQTATAGENPGFEVYFSDTGLPG